MNSVEVSPLYLKAKLFVGLTPAKDPVLSKLQTLWKWFSLVITGHTIVSICWAVCIAQDKYVVIENALYVVTAGGLWLHWFLFLIFRDNFDACMSWCGQVQSRFPIEEAILECRRASERVFKIFILGIPTCAGVFFVCQAIITSIIRGEVVPSFEMYVFLRYEEGYWENIYLFFVSNFCAYILTVYSCLVFVVIICTLMHFNALLEVLQKIARSNFGSETTPEAFRSTIEALVSHHCELLQHLNLLIPSSVLPILFFEGIFYASALLDWIIFFFAPQNCYRACVTLINFGPYFQVTYENEKLADTIEELRKTLYDLPWYDMTPQHQRSLMLVMINLSRVQLVCAGPLHVVCYKELGVILNRVYTFGLAVSKFLG